MSKPEPLAVQLGRLLTAARERQEKSRRGLATESGVSDVTLLMYERGSENPTLAKAEALAAAYGVQLVLMDVSDLATFLPGDTG